MEKQPAKLKSRLDSLYRPQSDYLRQSAADKILLGGSLAAAALLAAGLLAWGLWLAAAPAGGCGGLCAPARPLAAAAASLVLTALLAIIWLPGPERREYLFLALLAALHSLNNVLRLDLTRPLLSAAVLSCLSYYGAVLQACLPAFAGFAFARMNARFYRLGLPALLLAAAAGALAANTPALRAGAADAVLLWGTLAAGLAGSLACLGQAYALRGRPGAPRARLRRLLAFAAGLLLIAASSAFEPGAAAGGCLRLFFERLLHLPALLFLTYVALDELREIKRLAANSPVSSYHRKAELPEAVDGCVLMLDFKGSEKLFRLGTRLGIGGELVAKALTEAWEAVSAAGGEVIQTEGDALTGLLERRAGETDEGLAARAVGAVAGVRAALDGLAVSYRARGLLAPRENIAFRSACSPGRLRPAWREIGSTRQPFWLEAGGSNALVDTARLMELERRAPGDAGASRFVYPASMPGPGGEHLLGGKHGGRHRVRVLVIPARA